MTHPSRLCCSLALLLLSLTAGCRKEAEKAPAPAPAAVVPKPTPASPRVPEEQTPDASVSREDALACEALVDLRTLMDGQRAFFGETDHYTADPTRLPLLPACADGARTATPDATWMAGCHFRYRVTAASATPDGTFTLHAVGAGAAEGREYTVTSGTLDSQRVWPASLTLEVCGDLLAPSVCEAALGLRSVYTAERSFFQEKDLYSGDLTLIGFLPEPCLDGTRLGGGEPPATGCHYTYRVEVQGVAPEQTFTAIARDAEGAELRLDSSSTWTPAEPACGP